MKTHNLLYFTVGAALGYFAAKKGWFEKQQPAASKIADATKELVTGAKELIVDTAKQASCELKWAEKSKSVKYASKEAYEKAHDAFISECMKSNLMT